MPGPHGASRLDPRAPAVPGPVPMPASGIRWALRLPACSTWAAAWHLRPCPGWGCQRPARRRDRRRRGAIALVDGFLALMAQPHATEVRDLVAPFKAAPTDVALLLKLVPILDRQHPDAGSSAHPGSDRGPRRRSASQWPARRTAAWMETTSAAGPTGWSPALGHVSARSARHRSPTSWSLVMELRPSDGGAGA